MLPVNGILQPKPLERRNVWIFLMSKVFTNTLSEFIVVGFFLYFELC